MPPEDRASAGPADATDERPGSPQPAVAAEPPASPKRKRTRKADGGAPAAPADEGPGSPPPAPPPDVAAEPPASSKRKRKRKKADGRAPAGPADAPDERPGSPPPAVAAESPVSAKRKRKKADGRAPAGPAAAAAAPDATDERSGSPAPAPAVAAEPPASSKRKRKKADGRAPAGPADAPDERPGSPPAVAAESPASPKRDRKKADGRAPAGPAAAPDERPGSPPPPPAVAAEPPASSKRKRKKADGRAPAGPADVPDKSVSGRWLSHAQLKALGVDYKKGPFSYEEGRALAAAVVRYQEENGLSDEGIRKEIFKSRRTSDPNYKQSAFWTEISRALPDRPLIAVYNFLRRSKHEARRSGKWAAEEDTLLRQLQKEFGNQWEKIGERIGRLGPDCRDRFRDVHQRGSVGEWGAEEIQRLQDAVSAVPDRSRLPWSAIALKVGTRNAQQCRLKFEKMESLPTRWTFEEDKRLSDCLYASDANSIEEFLSAETTAESCPGKTVSDIRRRYTILRYLFAKELKQFDDIAEALKKHFDVTRKRERTKTRPCILKSETTDLQ